MRVLIFLLLTASRERERAPDEFGDSQTRISRRSICSCANFHCAPYYPRLIIIARARARAGNFKVKIDIGFCNRGNAYFRRRDALLKKSAPPLPREIYRVSWRDKPRSPFLWVNRENSNVGKRIYENSYEKEKRRENCTRYLLSDVLTNYYAKHRLF